MVLAMANSGTALFRVVLALLAFFALHIGLCDAIAAADMELAPLVTEALDKNPELLAAQARAGAARERITMARGLPDPMLSAGYQNVGLRSYTYPKNPDAQWTFGLSQTLPNPAKLVHKGRTAEHDAENMTILIAALRLKTTVQVKELFHDLFWIYKTLDLLKDKAAVFARLEDAALARYASGMGTAQETVMAQTEKYMLLEKETMLAQKKTALESQLCVALGRAPCGGLGRPATPAQTAFAYELDELLTMAQVNDPTARSKEKLIEKAQSQIKAAKAEFLPDFTFAAGYGNKGEYMVKTDMEGNPANEQRYMDMWSTSVSITLPLYFWKQVAGVREAKRNLSEAQHDLDNARQAAAAVVRENYSMIKAADRLVDLYKNGLAAKNAQNFDLTLSRYATGKLEVFAAVGWIKNVLEYETSYWGQVVEREKAVARIAALAGVDQAPAAQKAPGGAGALVTPVVFGAPFEAGIPRAQKMKTKDEK